jgi:anti-anti-sigma factor
VFPILLKLREQIQAAGGRLVVCGLRPEIAEIRELTGLKRLLRTFEDVQEALASFGCAAGQDGGRICI